MNTFVYYTSPVFARLTVIAGLPQKFNDRDYKSPTDVPCVVQLLCDKYEGLVIEAKGIKEHWWKPYIRKLFRREVRMGSVVLGCVGLQ